MKSFQNRWLKINHEYIKKYIEKTGDKYIVVGDCYEQFDNGFVTYAVHPEYIFVYNVYGIGQAEEIERHLRDVAKKHGVGKVRFATKRNPTAFQRKFGAKVIGYILEVDVTEGGKDG